jgi:hypothetical protein
MRPLSLSVTVAATALAMVGAAPAAHAGGGYQYSFTSSVVETQTTTGVGDDTGVCEPIETVTLTAHEALHATATEAGLDQEEIEALLDSDDPDGIILRATYTETGTFVADEGGHTYTGHFTQWFGGGLAGGQFVFTFTFDVVGRSELGTPLRAHFASHFVGGDVTKVAFDKGTVTGCLPAV